jgi:hypothetical protein
MEFHVSNFSSDALVADTLISGFFQTQMFFLENNLKLKAQQPEHPN